MKSLSRVQLFVTPWTAAYQAPPSMGFSRQEYWSGLPLPSPVLNPRCTQIQVAHRGADPKCVISIYYKSKLYLEKNLLLRRIEIGPYHVCSSSQRWFTPLFTYLRVFSFYTTYKKRKIWKEWVQPHSPFPSKLFIKSNPTHRKNDLLSLRMSYRINYRNQH